MLVTLKRLAENLLEDFEARLLPSLSLEQDFNDVKESQRVLISLHPSILLKLAQLVGIRQNKSLESLKEGYIARCVWLLEGIADGASVEELYKVDQELGMRCFELLHW